MLSFRLAAFFVFVPVTALIANSDLGASLALDMVCTQSQREEFNGEIELRENLELVNREIQRRIAIKEVLIAELIAGQTTLAAVTDQFLIMNQCRPEYMIIIRATYPGNTDFEKTAHNVIGFVGAELPRLSPAAQTEVCDRLETQLQCLSGTHTAGTN